MDISCKNLTKIFDIDAYALKNLNLRIKSGDFAVVMGESGSGKSTLLRVIAGLEKCTSGGVYFDGIPMEDVPAQKRNIAMVFQQYILYPNMTVYENIAFYDKTHGVGESEVDTKVRSVARLLGLTTVLNRRPKYLSGGQQQRVALAKALMRSPDVILFDEPLSNVDESARQEYEKMLIALKRRLPDTTFIYVTHRVDEALKLSRHIAVLKDGGLIAFGTPDEVINNPQCAETMYILAGDKATLQNGTLKDGKILSDDREIQLSNLIKATINDREEGQIDFCEGFFDSPYPLLFDSFGMQIGGVKDEYLLLGQMDGDKLYISGNENTIDSKFLSRIISKEQEVLVKVRAEDIHYFYCDGDFSLNTHVTYAENGVAVFANEFDKIALRTDRGYKIGEEVTLYFNADAIELFTHAREKITSKYEIKPNVAVGRKKLGNKVKIGSSVLCPNKKLLAKEITVEIPFDSFTGYSKRSKNALKIRACLDEDFLGEDKLVYAVVDGFDDYVTLKINSHRHVLKRKQFYIGVDINKINIKNGRQKHS